MRIKILAIFSFVVFIAGGLIGGGYGFLSANNIVAPVSQLLPANQTAEEKMIDNFITTQEQKQSDEANAAKDPEKPDEKTLDTSKGDTIPEKNAANDAKETPVADKSDKSTEKTPTASSDDGWIKLGKGEQIGQPTVNDGKSLNLRKSASSKSEVIGSVSNTDKLILDAKQNGWYHVTTKSGMEGWVSADYIKVIK